MPLTEPESKKAQAAREALDTIEEISKLLVSSQLTTFAYHAVFIDSYT